MWLRVLQDEDRTGDGISRDRDAQQPPLSAGSRQAHPGLGSEELDRRPHFLPRRPTATAAAADGAARRTWGWRHHLWRLGGVGIAYGRARLARAAPWMGARPGHSRHGWRTAMECCRHGRSASVGAAHAHRPADGSTEPGRPADGATEPGRPAAAAHQAVRWQPAGRGDDDLRAADLPAFWPHPRDTPDGAFGQDWGPLRVR
mmetsp:Transcript_350/g.753  ORF Transcript_350/g.753 Transcript_350/m.753 type:complete len:202 (+) Transcript_350:171-776(+)